MKKLTTKHEKTEENKNIKSGVQTFSAIKIISLILCITLLFAMLTACGNDDLDDPLLGEAGESAETNDNPVRGDGSDEEESENETTHPSQDFSDRIAENFEESMTTFGRNDIMISAGDQHVTWAELYIFIFNAVANLTGFFESPVDWSEVIDAESETTIAEMVLDFATNNAIDFLSQRYGAANIGASLDQDDFSDVEDHMQMLVDHYGSLEELSVVLREEFGYFDYELYEDILLTQALLGAVMRELYGDYGADLPDEDAAAFAERQGYMMAKHILIMLENNDNARNEADEIYNRLRPRAADADFEDFFTEMMLEYSEDPGSIANPAGYLFHPRDMVEPFSAATMLLSPGEMSEVVETSFGYHIILRVPTDFDAVPVGVAQMGHTHTIRQLAAGEDFEFRMSQWREQMNIEFSALYDSIDIAKIFAWIGV